MSDAAPSDRRCNGWVACALPAMPWKRVEFKALQSGAY
jgi:hypothetical protein